MKICIKIVYVVITPKYAFLKVCKILLTKIRRNWKYEYALPKYTSPKVKYVRSYLLRTLGNPGEGNDISQLLWDRADNLPLLPTGDFVTFVQRGFETFFRGLVLMVGPVPIFLALALAATKVFAEALKSSSFLRFSFGWGVIGVEILRLDTGFILILQSQVGKKYHNFPIRQICKG